MSECEMYSCTKDAAVVSASACPSGHVLTVGHCQTDAAEWHASLAVDAIRCLQCGGHVQLLEAISLAGVG